MERLTKVWNSLRAMLLRQSENGKENVWQWEQVQQWLSRLLGSLMGSKPMIVKQMGEITVTQEASGKKRKNQIPGMMILTGRSPVVMRGNR